MRVRSGSLESRFFETSTWPAVAASMWHLRMRGWAMNLHHLSLSDYYYLADSLVPTSASSNHLSSDQQQHGYLTPLFSDRI